ncbi:MAG: gamma-glutamyltransferase family protein [Caulobacterales bacterium]
MKRFAALAFVLTLSACAYSAFKEPAVTDAPRAWRLKGHAMVAAADPRAVDAGLEILRAGGSAVDAAIATELVLGLVEPQSSGLGGGGFMMSYDFESKALDLFDGRETAPGGASAAMFVGEDGKPLDFASAAHSGLSVGSPGLVPMFWMAHQQEGKLPWAKLFEPAIKLAEDGFAVSPRLTMLLDTSKKRGRLALFEPAKSYFYDAKGNARQPGYILKNLAYAATLRAIADQGPKALQEGSIAARIVKTVQDDKRPGTLALSDLRDYKPVKRTPLCLEYRAYNVCSTPPPGGGIGVLSALGMLAHQPKIAGGVNDPNALGLFIDSSRLAYADRDYYVADPEAVSVPSKGLLNPQYLKVRAKLVQVGKKLAAAGPGDPSKFSGEQSLFGKWAGDKTDEVPGTTHLSIVDENGDAVALTATVEAAFGNQRMTDGFVLNNQLTDFATAPSLDGRPFANAPAPFKRPRSSMAPTIIFDKSGEFYAATGSPGGNAIIAYTLKTIVGMIDWGLTPQEAVALPNIIARQGAVRIELAKTAPQAVDDLKKRGYAIADFAGETSGLHIVRAGPTGLEGGADPRREGAAKGY